MISVDHWTPADGLSLEPNALSAAKDVERNLALTAGPGAGKTEMLAQRADFLLRTGVCRYPKRVLAISFKVDASQNLKARVRKRCGPDLAARFDSHTFHAFAKRIIDRFRTVLVGNDALDPDYSIGPQREFRRAITFSDMVPLAVQIVESSDIARRAIRQTYSHVFLDEFQDCTGLQYQLIKACFLGSRARLTAVGDTKQRIMAWAGALEGVFQEYANDFGARSLVMYQNFRSKMRLRRMQNAMVERMDPAAAVDERRLQGDEGEIEVLRYSDDDEEATAVAELIRQWIEDEDVEPAEIAVLVSKQQSLFCQKLRAAMDAAGVPYRDEDATQDLASEPVTSLIIDFLLVATGQRQPAAYRRLHDLMVFSQGLDDEKEYQAGASWNRFVADANLQIRAGTCDLTQKEDLAGLVTQVLNRVGREAIIAMSPAYTQGAWLDQKIAETINRAHALLKDGDDVATAFGSFAGDCTVKIMSIHKSKGLEFDSIVILGVETQTFWSDAEAERSAFFVGISRAKRRLFLTAVEQRERPVGLNTRWTAARTEHEEFLGYALPYL